MGCMVEDHSHVDSKRRARHCIRGSSSIHQWTKQRPEANHFIVVTTLMIMHPCHWVCVWVCIHLLHLLPQLPLPCPQFLGGAVSATSAFLALSLGGCAKTTDRTFLTGDGSSNCADVLAGQRTCRPRNTLAASRLVTWL